MSAMIVFWGAGVCHPEDLWSIYFSFATWRIQSFLWPPSAGLSRYLSRDLLGWPHSVRSLQCRKPVGHLCCKLYCFVFLEFLEIQRRNAVLSSSLWGTNVGSRWTEGPDGRRAAVTVISVVGRRDWMSVTARRYFTTAAVWPFGRRALPPRIRHR